MRTTLMTMTLLGVALCAPRFAVVTRTISLDGSTLTETRMLDETLPTEDESQRRSEARDMMQSWVSTAMDIIESDCGTITALPRVAPLVFARIRMLDGTDSNAVMQTVTYMVTQEANHSNTDTENYWVPLSLLRYQFQNDSASLAALNAYNQWDMRIVVNTNFDVIQGFAVGNSSCDFVDEFPTYYSATSVLLHEMLHGMGIYSMLDPDVAGGTLGWGSLYDSLIRDEEGQLLIGSGVIPSAQSLAGRSLTVGGVPLYNPGDPAPGSSLSHFDWPYLMGYTIPAGVCVDTMPAGLIGVLGLLGWPCATPEAPFAWEGPVAAVSAQDLGGAGTSGSGSLLTIAIVTVACIAGVVLLAVGALCVHAWCKRRDKVATHAVPDILRPPSTASRWAIDPAQSVVVRMDESEALID
jgi:hypothetical protein